MNLYKSIFQRKSCRKFDMKPLSQEFLEKVETTIKNFVPLFHDVKLHYHFCNKVKGPYHVEAPNYIQITGEGKPLELESAGFLFEQLVLWFDSMDIGCVWLGESKDVNLDKSIKHIVTIAFGNPLEKVHRTKEEFKRKPIESITNDPDDFRIQAAHYAPSGMNTQPWYFEKQNDKILVYKKKLKPPISLLYKQTDLDMGIALCHFYLACKENNKKFNFEKNENLPKKSGFLSFGIIS